MENSYETGHTRHLRENKIFKRLNNLSHYFYQQSLVSKFYLLLIRALYIKFNLHKNLKESGF